MMSAGSAGSALDQTTKIQNWLCQKAVRHVQVRSRPMVSSRGRVYGDRGVDKRYWMSALSEEKKKKHIEVISDNMMFSFQNSKNIIYVPVIRLKSEGY